MSNHFADRLVDVVRGKGAGACVGLDPLMDRLPTALTVGDATCGAGILSAKTQAGSLCHTPSAGADVIRRFCLDLLEIVAPLVPVVKVNIAFFEPYRGPGVAAYHDVVYEARRAGLLVIGDVKRADIGHSTTQYALAHLSDEPPESEPHASACAMSPLPVHPCEPEESRGLKPRGSGADAPPGLKPRGSLGLCAADAVTVNPYLGFDAIKPFAQIAGEQDKGLFVLVQTSNESAAAVQGLELVDGGTVCEAVGRLVQTWASDPALIGESRYSCIGAVVSPRDLPSTVRLRAIMPSCYFLVPGFGAQGRTAQEVAHCFKEDGTGAIVNASRSVIYAHEKEAYRAEFGDDWKACVRQGCRDFVAQIRTLTRH